MKLSDFNKVDELVGKLNKAKQVHYALTSSAAAQELGAVLVADRIEKIKADLNALGVEA